MASAWLKRYREGSYNNIPFFMDSHRTTIGRDKVVHEFPGRDDVETEDLGKKPKRFSMNIYILADDYFGQRNDLIIEIEDVKRGLLVHPYLGEIEIQILDCTFSETWDEGRMVRFTIDAIQDSVEPLTIEIVDTKTDVLTKRDSLLDSLNTFFNEVYTITQAPIDQTNQLIATLDATIDTVENAKKIVKSIAEYEQQLQRIKARVSVLVFSGQDLYAELQALQSFGTDTNDDDIEQIDVLTDPSVSRDQFFEMQNVADDNLVPLDLTDLNSVMTNMNYQNSIASMAGLLATVEYESEEDADSLTTILYDFLDNLETDTSIPTEVKDAVRDIRSSIFIDSERRTAGLGTVYTYKVEDESLPSLVIANSIYGNIDNEQALLDRNNIQEPFFLSEEITAVVNNE